MNRSTIAWCVSVGATCLSLTLGGCQPAGDNGPPGDSLTLQSTAFNDGEPIPVRFTDDGDDVSPPLSWSNVPAGTRELALIVDDPDAPRPEPFVHWVVYRIPPTATGLPEAVPATEALTEPAGALQGTNDAGTIGYRGPAPPAGSGVHNYHFKLYALDEVLDVEAGLTKAELLVAMEGHILAQTEIAGTYER